MHNLIIRDKFNEAQLDDDDNDLGNEEIEGETDIDPNEAEDYESGERTTPRVKGLARRARLVARIQQCREAATRL